jgi:Fe-S-cluster-containing hydrogenase component 2
LKLLKADIACYETIPCNPCETACPFGAIVVGEDITALPRFDAEACRGCGICLAVCPGLAIRLVEIPEEGQAQATVAFPYEYVDLPQPGQIVGVVDMDGRRIGRGVVEAVRRHLKDDPTQVVYVRVPVEIVERVQSMERNGGRRR